MSTPTPSVNDPPALARASAFALPANPARLSVIKRFLAGLRFGVAGLFFAFRDAKLLGLSIVPMLVHGALFVMLTSTQITFLMHPLLDWLGPSSEAQGFFASAGHAVWSVVVHVLVGAFILATSLVLTIFIGSIVCDPFYDALSERTEALYLGHDTGDPFSVAAMLRGMLHELGVTLVRLCVYATVAAPLWALSFTPAAIVATPLGLGWTWLFVAFEFLARPMTRHARAPSARIRALFAHKAVFFGFGLVGWLLSFLPFTAPLLVISGTRLYLAMAADADVPHGLSDDDTAALRAARGT